MNNEHQRLYALTEHILNLMQENAGPISFQKWMQAALYQPKLGYYESTEIFGKQGDFTTASAMGPWLALAFAETINKSWLALGSPTSWTLIEQGGGSGDLLCNTVKALKDIGLQPTQIIAVETSEQLRQQQRDNFISHHIDVNQYTSLKEIPVVEHAIMYSNELPDAFPVSSFIWKNNTIIERGVDWNEQTFIWAELETLPASDTSIADSLQQQWPEAYISEFNPQLPAWQNDITNVFEQGVVLTVDYGYTQQEYYRPQRVDGTLMGHYQHQVVDDVLKLSPGLCDITAHVDFTTLKQAGEKVGLESLAYTTQGAWLAQSEAVQRHIQKLAANPDVDSIAQITQAKRLMLPNGMGESFKILIQGKGTAENHNLKTAVFDRLETL